MENNSMNFSVVNRNYGHWDITNREYGRMFRIRGGPGKYQVLDEREISTRKQNRDFKTISACMAYICDELMFELIVAEGQEPHVIAAWNII